MSKPTTREVVEQAIKALDCRIRFPSEAIPARDALQALLDEGLEDYIEEHGLLYKVAGFREGATQMRERCGSNDVAVTIAREAHRIYGQRDNRDTDGFDAALVEFIEDGMRGLALRGKDE